MNYVIDSSALLAVLRKEQGYLPVLPLLAGSQMSTVNMAEVVQKAQQWGILSVSWVGDLQMLGIEIVPFSVEQAEATGLLWHQTQSLGLSLGDRACLALAQSCGGVAVTADRNWGGVTGIQVQVIR